MLKKWRCKLNKIITTTNQNNGGEGKYKTIQTVISNPSKYNNVCRAIKDLNLIYPAEDLYLEVKNNMILTHLRSLDLDEFKRKVVSILDKYQLNFSDDTWKRLIKGIENIGSYGVKAGKRIFVDFNKERKVAGRKAKEKKRGMYFYTNGNSFKIENNYFPREYENKIICGDSKGVLKNLPDNCVDLVFTSPPYNFGLEYDTTEDGVNWEGYFNKLFGIFDECIRVLKYGGRVVINVQPLFSDYIPSHHIISTFFMNKKLIWKGEIIWEKNNYNCKYTAWGSWKSPSNPYLKYTWEFLEIFCKGTMQKSGNKDDIDIAAEEFKKWVVAKWSIAPERNMKKFEHPAMFPEDLVYRVLKLFSFKNDVVLDPFNGVGTTTTVAKKLGRRYLGIDISDEYCKKAKQREENTLF